MGGDGDAQAAEQLAQQQAAIQAQKDSDPTTTTTCSWMSGTTRQNSKRQKMTAQHQNSSQKPWRASKEWNSTRTTRTQDKFKSNSKLRGVRN